MLSHVGLACRPTSGPPSQASITTGLIELVSGTEASFHLFYAVLQGNSGASKNKGTVPSGTLSHMLFIDLENFATGTSIV